MNKKIIRCVLEMAIIAVMLSGCGQQTEDMKLTEKTNETVVIEEAEESSETVAIEEQEEIAESVEIVEPEEKRNLYLDFLNDEAELYFSKYNQYDSWNDEVFFEKGKGYTLSEIVDVFAERYFKYSNAKEMDSIRYAYMDCGMDGVKELAICFDGMDIYYEDDDSTLVYIIKDINSQLELCYAYETWARSSTSINEYGYSKGGGSNSATNHGGHYGIVDQNGDWKFIVREQEELDISMVNYPEELSRIPSVAANKSYEGTIAFRTITLADYMDGGKYVGTSPEDNIYSFEVLDENYEWITEPSMYTDSVYKEIFDEAGVTVVPEEEIAAIIAEKEKQVGLTEEIRNGNELEWIVWDGKVTE